MVIFDAISDRGHEVLFAIFLPLSSLAGNVGQAGPLRLSFSPQVGPQSLGRECEIVWSNSRAIV